MSVRPIGVQLLHALMEHGAGEVFGIPGDFVLPFFRQVEESAVLPLYTLSHEPAVGFAADAAARIRPGLGVAAVTYGAGALNMVNAVAAAYAEKSPVVVISGGPGRREGQKGLLLHHQARALDSQARIFREVTCDQTRLDDPATASADFARVLQAAVVSSRPVYIELPRDMVDAPCGPVTPTARPPADPDAVAACADEVLARLSSARRPVVMVGVEVRRFGLESQVAELTDRLGVPVVTSFLGRGLLAGTAPPPAGTYLGAAGAPEITELVEGSDGLLLLGVILSDTNLGVSSRAIDLRRTVQALDGRVTLDYHTYPDVSLADLVAALLARVAYRPLTGGEARPPACPRGMPADDAPITPLDIATAVNDLMAEVGRFPVTADMGDCLFTALDIGDAELLATGYYATMGFAVPAALGVQAASGRRPLVLVGDGAFQMTGWELGNCRRYGWDPIVLVFNNAGWEMLRAFQPGSRFNTLDRWDFAALAAGLGGDGLRVQTRRELAAALRSAAARRGRFQLIDIQIPAGVLSPTLSRFVDGIRRLHR
ncbi:MAG: indolepyruvate/phenylpyruvate decarboxylase [Gemmataceae bacterium]